VPRDLLALVVGQLDLDAPARGPGDDVGDRPAGQEGEGAVLDLGDPPAFRVRADDVGPVLADDPHGRGLLVVGAGRAICELSPPGRSAAQEGKLPAAGLGTILPRSEVFGYRERVGKAPERA